MHASRRRSDRHQDCPLAVRSDSLSRLYPFGAFPSRPRCAVGIESRAVCSQGNKYFSAPGRDKRSTEFVVQRIARDRGRAHRSCRLSRRCLEPLGHLSGSHFHGLKDTLFASFAIEPAFASGKPQNFKCRVHHSQRPSIGWAARRRYLNDRRVKGQCWRRGLYDRDSCVSRDVSALIGYGDRGVSPSDVAIGAVRRDCADVSWRWPAARPPPPSSPAASIAIRRIRQPAC